MRRLLACAAALAAASPDPALALSIEYVPVVMVGDPAPGLPGESFTSAPPGHVNDAGQVAISGFVGTGFSTGVWRWDLATGGAPAPVALPGLQAPDAPAGVVLASAFVREMTASGRIGYEARFRIGTGGVTESTNSALYVDDPAAGSSLLVRDGDPVPGLPGHTFILDAQADAIPAFNADGALVFGALTLPPVITFPLPGGAWTHDGTTLRPVVLAGDPVPGFPGTFGVPNIYDIDDQGRASFAASVGGSSAFGIYQQDASGALHEVARTFGPAAGVDGGFYAWIPGGGDFDLNQAGQLAFAAQLLAGIGPVTSANDWGIWVAEGPGDIVLRHREGDPAPGAPAGALFGEFSTPSFNAAGELAFAGSLQLGSGGVTSLNDGAIWGPDGAGGLRMLAREGDPVPGLPGEVWSNLLSVRLNERGEVLFAALVGGRYSLFFVDEAGRHHLLVREGDPVDLGGGDVRVLESVAQWEASPSLHYTAIRGRFADGSAGLFLIAIPEPGTAALLALGLAALARRATG